MLARPQPRTLAPAAIADRPRHDRANTEPRPAIEQSSAELSLVSLVIATQRRPLGLANAVRSTFRQMGVDLARMELVVVDNDPTPSAHPLIAELAAQAPFPVHYVHEPLPGVANARNAALAKAAGGLIVFLDDDEEAAPDWLAALLDAQVRFDADAVFGPVRARTPESLGDHRGYLETFFSRHGPVHAGEIARYYGCGNSLVRRSGMPNPAQPFSPARNRSGGEDDLLFSQMQQRGARFAWAPRALVFEIPVPERLTLDYALRRAFVYGQGPSRAAFTETGAALSAAPWMALGLAQAAAWAPIAAALWTLRAPGRALALDRMLRGLGKLLWWGPFRIYFYGRSAPDADNQPARRLPS